MTSFECGDLVRPCFHFRFVLSEMTVIQVTPASSCVVVDCVDCVVVLLLIR